MAQAVMVKVEEVKVAEEVHKKNRIQVSNTKKPLFFYLNLAKVYPSFLFHSYCFQFLFIQLCILPLYMSLFL